MISFYEFNSRATAQLKGRFYFDKEYEGKKELEAWRDTPADIRKKWGKDDKWERKAAHKVKRLGQAVSAARKVAHDRIALNLPKPAAPIDPATARRNKRRRDLRKAKKS